MKVGDRVIGRNNSRINNKLGTIINIPNEDCISVEFDENIHGHNCPYSRIIKGKRHHCWNCDLHEIELINKEPNYEIY